jgi:hypothetical protein
MLGVFLGFAHLALFMPETSTVLSFGRGLD